MLGGMDCHHPVLTALDGHKKTGKMSRVELIISVGERDADRGKVSKKQEISRSDGRFEPKRQDQLWH